MSVKHPLFAFFGTPKFSVDVLNALEAKGFLPALVITAPERPRGRGLKLTPSPAKAWAQERGIDVLTPATLKDPAVLEALQNTEWDVFVVAAYAKLIPKSILEIPRRGITGVDVAVLKDIGRKITRVPDVRPLPTAQTAPFQLASPSQISPRLRS